MRAPTTTLATALLLATVLTAAGGALAQETPYVPTPGTNDLGWSENDVRDEPNHGDDENGFPDTGFSPGSASLVLDAYTETRFGSPFILVTYDEDVDAVRHNAMPGTSHAEGDQAMYPGKVSYEAWWGYWTDKGSGGDLQQNPTTEALVDTTPDARIDDADDCDDASWDEFVWRGGNGCVEDTHPAHAPADSMYAFVQPGTHNRHVNSCVLGSGPLACNADDGADLPTEPDFIYEDILNAGGQTWRQANGFSRIEYDASLLITTEVVSAVNPKEISTGSGDGDTRYDPYEMGDGASTHAVDVDLYGAVDPMAEQAYRTAIWDPGDANDNPTDDVHEEGAKAYLKDDLYPAYTSTVGAVNDNLSRIQEIFEPFQGAADDIVSGPYPHEPNTDEDDYPASLEASYGGLDDYYQAHSQDYSAYQNNELFWVDAQVDINTFPVWIPFCCYGYSGYTQITPETPEPTDPAGSTLDEGDDNTQGPGILYLHAFVGTWHDADGDTWVGTADDPYEGGTDDDPNSYGSSEFRGTCEADFSTTLIPTEDTDGDTKGEWGAAGVYVIGSFGDANPYSDMVMDVGGEEANTATEPLREAQDPVGGTASYVFPSDSDGRLSKYRTDGPIPMNSWFSSKVDCQGPGDWDNNKALLLPTGSLDFAFKAVSEIELTDKLRVSLHGDNSGESLTGQTIKDVDTFESVLGTGGLD